MFGFILAFVADCFRLGAYGHNHVLLLVSRLLKGGFVTLILHGNFFEHVNNRLVNAILRIGLTLD